MRCAKQNAFIDEFYSVAKKKGEREAEKFIKVSGKEMDTIKKRINELDNIIRCLYEDRVAGRITVERYETLSSGYEQEQAEQKHQLESLTGALNEQDMREKILFDFIENSKKYVDIKILTPEILHTFIRRIELHEKDILPIMEIRLIFIIPLSSKMSSIPTAS